MLTIIDWNLNGLRSHYEDLRKLMNEHRPQIVCIQETKLHPACSLSLRGYDVFRRDNISDGHACGGVAILSDAAICATKINIQSQLQAICIAIQVPLKLTVCSIYAPPSPVVLSRDDLADLVNQLPQPYLLVGDFNAHHRSWGSNTCSPRGEMIVKVCDDLNSVVLNDGSPTYLCPRNGSWSVLPQVRLGNHP
jgi:exonuclease III